MDVVARHAAEVPRAVDLEPAGVVGAVDDDVGAIPVGGQDRGVDLLRGDAGDGVALGGADEVAGRVVGRAGGFRSGCVEG